ncbi:hypothetical protein KCU67_g804, partial [Aureobasidium melanogenum]
MQLLPVFSLFLTVHSLAIEQRSCVSSDVVAVAQQVNDPHYFCAWYLSDGRTKSPIQNIGANALLKACKCITSVEPAGADAKNLAAIAKAARLQSFVSATCSSTSGNPISKEFKDSSSFCSFFNSFERHDSPIPNLNVPAVRHACKCVLENPITSTKKSSTKPLSTLTKKPSTRSSLSSHKTSVSKTLSILSIKSSSKPIVKSFSSKTSATKSSSSKFSSSKLSSPSKASASRASSKLPSSKISTSTKTSSSTKSPSKASSVHPIPTVDAYNIITSEQLEAFCTTYLHYTIPSATVTVTAFATITEMNNFTLSTTLTTISVSTETDIVGTVTTTADEIMDKRSEATPAALAAYPENAISSGCSRAAKLPGTQTMAETITLTSIETIATTIVTTAYTTEASIATEAATSTVTALAPVYTGTPCGTQPYGALWEGSKARYKLYCDGYYFAGYPFSQATTS